MFKLQYRKTDILIVGGGIAGLRAAVSALEAGSKALVLAKGPRCSAGIGGFNAPVGSGDSVSLYYDDIIASGRGLSQPELARLLAEKSGEEMRWLESKGAEFDRTADGYDLLRPLGCTVPRLVHRKNITGSIEEKILLSEIERMGGEVINDAFVLDLISDGESVYGALAVIDGSLYAVTGRAVVLAAGGCGAIYPLTVYPKGICGDSYGMAARAGAEMTDMEFMQFEPCCLLEPEALRGKGISTTMLSAGGRLVNVSGEGVIEKYTDDPANIQKGELSRAIYAESKATGGKPCYYDLTAMPAEEINAHCIFYEALCAQGYDPSKTKLPVMPAAHTFLGGVSVTADCRSSLKRLYAAGEAIGGLHGANRIGGCAGSEVLVFGAEAGRNAASEAQLTDAEFRLAEETAEKLASGYSGDTVISRGDISAYVKELQDVAVNDLGIIRNAELSALAEKSAAAMLERLSGASADDAAGLCELTGLRNMLLTVRMIAKASGMREESRGVFFREDHPDTDPAFEKNIKMKYCGGILNAYY